MSIAICEYCGKPFSNPYIKLCNECSKIIDDSYIKARKYIYKNPKASDFASIIQETEIPEKALSYLINMGRIEIANRTGSGLRCRACGKETNSGNLCERCISKLASEKTKHIDEEIKKVAAPNAVTGSRKIIPKSFND